MLRQWHTLIRWRIWRLIVPLILLWLLSRLVDVDTVVHSLQRVHWPWLLAGVMLVQGQVLLSAWRWQFTAGRLGCHLRTGQVVREYYLATLLNQILPGGVTGDVARAGRNRGTHGLAVVGQSVVLERLAGQLSLLLLCVIGLAVWPWLLRDAIPANGLMVLGTAMALMLSMAILAFVGTRYAPQRVRRFLQGLKPAMHQAWLDNGAWRTQAVLSLPISLSYLALYAVCAWAIDAPLPAVAWLTVIPLTLLTMLIPVSIGGWGVREAAASALWPLVGLSSEAGLATSLLYGLLCLVGALPGLYVISRGSLVRA